MGKLILKTNVRVMAEAPFPKAIFDKIIEEEYNGDVRNYVKEAKNDLINAFVTDLGFDAEHINVTKFELECVADDEEEVTDVER